MNDDQIAHLELERDKGQRAKHAFNNFIQPFVEEKRLVLFEAFQEVSVSNKDDLLEIKRQLMAINALETEIQTIIETGIMAEKALVAEQEKSE